MTDACKPLSRAAIPRALEKVERYRLLNEPTQAESVCLDVLAVEPDNQTALVGLLLSICDQLDARSSAGVRPAEEVLARLTDDYQRAYYRGVIRDRWAGALLEAGDPGKQALGWIHDAMRCYDAAQALQPGGNDDAILRWNACLRLIEREHLQEHAAENEAAGFDVGFDCGDAAPRR